MGNQKNIAPHQGSCLCGEVVYEIISALKDGSACHCSQCRRTTGNYFVSTNIKNENFRFVKNKSLRWYQSSTFAERGFCQHCGSNLFYRPIDGDHISVTLGTLDQPTGIKIAKHIFVADKPDFYELTDDIPKMQAYKA